MAPVAAQAAAARAAAAPAGPGPRAAVQAYAERFAVPATVAVLVDREGAVTTVPHGVTSEGAPVTADTPFRIASMSKAFTAVAVLQLAEAGRIDLDGPVAAALPGFTVADPRAGDVTVRHLLAHTSGLSNQDVDEFALPPAASAAALVERLSRVPLAADPGTVHQYLNANYVVAARLVEVVTGRPFADHLHDAVLAPLGMNSTVATDRCDAAVPGLARGHVGALGVQVPAPEIPSFCAGDGGVVSTAADLTRWVRFQLGDGTAADGTRLLSTAALRGAHTPSPGTDGRYGLGWSVRTADDGRTRVLHGGALATWSSGIELSSAGSAAFVLTDASGGNPGALAADLVARADGAPGVPVDDPYRPLNLALLGLTVLAAALLGTAVLRARRRAARLGGRRRVVALPALAVGAGILLLPALSLLAGPPSATAWTLVLWLLPLSGVLALVLMAGGTAALVARSGAARAERGRSPERPGPPGITARR
ncbi:serine hydrolase domain-containing protein [Pseudonocardia kongjuensis]|uniref:serine hydrolase domain-containing protein n=1 Tax=Pseudonocardia kongjuensis TaxID=102227 RepID=UPI0031D9EE21